MGEKGGGKALASQTSRKETQRQGQVLVGRRVSSGRERSKGAPPLYLPPPPSRLIPRHYSLSSLRPLRLPTSRTTVSRLLAPPSTSRLAARRHSCREIPHLRIHHPLTSYLLRTHLLATNILFLSRSAAPPLPLHLSLSTSPSPPLPLHSKAGAPLIAYIQAVRHSSEGIGAGG